MQSQEVLGKVLAAMNSIKNNLQDGANGNTKHFFLINREGARAAVLRSRTPDRSFCDYRRAVGYMEDVCTCTDNATFANWPNNGENANKLVTTLGENVYPSKFFDQVTNKAKADGFWEQAITRLKEDCSALNMNLL